MGGTGSILSSTKINDADSNKQFAANNVVDKPTILESQAAEFIPTQRVNYVPKKRGFGSFKAKVDILKRLIKSDDFQDKFKKFMETKGKLPFVLCFQKLETLRKILLQEATRLDNSVDEEALKKESSELLVIIDKYSVITISPMDGKLLPVFNECFKLHVDIHRRGKITSQITLMNRIRLTQEQLLANLFDDFEEFFRTSDLQNIVPDVSIETEVEAEEATASLRMPGADCSISQNTAVLSEDGEEIFPTLHNTCSSSIKFHEVPNKLSPCVVQA